MMNGRAHLLREAARLTDLGEHFVLVTVTKAEGSTPRDEGARMIWLPTEEILGSVGGGEFEDIVREAARAHFDARSSGVEQIVLKTDADQCCGGTMEVFLEYFGPRCRLVVFGAGHVSAALVGLLGSASLDIVIADPRDDWNTEIRFPDCRRERSYEAGVDIAQTSPDETIACVMTCAHDDDYAIIRSLLREPLAFVGLIGSRSKWACFVRRLREQGLDDDDVKRVHCPIGLGNMGKEPELVAVSIAGQILLEAKKLESRTR